MTFPLSVDIFTKRDMWDVHPILPHCFALRPYSNLALAAQPVTQVSVERLFSAMSLPPSDLLSWLKQDAVETMLLLSTNMI